MPQRAATKPSPASGSQPAHREPLPRHAQARMIARTALAILLVLAALWIARAFLPGLAWAAIIAVTTWPLYVRFAALMSAGRAPALPALLFTLATGLLLFLPIGLAVHQLAQEGEAVVQWLAQLRDKGIPEPGWVAQLPIAGGYAAQWWRTNLSDPAGAGELLRGVNMDTASAWTRALGGQLLHRLFLFFVALIALFVLLRNGAWLGARVAETADRLLGDPGERLAGKMADAVRGTVNGTVVVAIAEGTLIGIAYVIAGVPNPLLFAVLTMAFAMLPFGAWAAFTTASLLLLFQGGSGWGAGGVFAWGAAVMLVGDHFVWPALVGSAARLPFLFALVGIFGGLQAFGLLGLFVGPVIMAALLTVWREWLMPDRR
jgi:predicted PurR-regulated permease PerM